MSHHLTQHDYKYIIFRTTDLSWFCSAALSSSFTPACSRSSPGATCCSGLHLRLSRTRWAEHFWIKLYLLKIWTVISYESWELLHCPMTCNNIINCSQSSEQTLQKIKISSITAVTTESRQVEPVCCGFCWSELNTQLDILSFWMEVFLFRNKLF